MAVKKSKFKKVADKLLNNTFADFKAPLTLKQTTSATYGQPATSISEAHEAIRLEYEASEIDGQSIQRGDFKLIAEAVKWVSVDVRADNVSATFNGEEVDIVSVISDPAGATYTFQARAK